MAWQRVLWLVQTVSVCLLASTVLLNSVSEGLPCSYVAKIGVCQLHWSISNATLVTQPERLSQINSTLAAINTVPEHATCVEAIRPVLCRKHFPNCGVSNGTSSQSQSVECQAVTTNCSELVAKIYASGVCPSIVAYPDNQCVQVNVSRDGYCPATNVYEIQAKGVVTFLEKASQEKKTLVNNLGNACEETYRRILCQSFISTFNCSTSEMTKEKCEQQLTCLSSNSTNKKRELCSKFQSKADPAQSTTQVTTSQEPQPTTVPTTLQFGNMTKTMVIFQLKSIKYKADYENKTTPLYAVLAKNATNALRDAYSSLPGFVTVELLGLTCDKKMVVHHNVLTKPSEDKPSLEAIKARLEIASESGFLNDRLVPSTISSSCETSSSTRVHEDNWVYMIVFVCITALLLLAMVLCNQSS